MHSCLYSSIYRFGARLVSIKENKKFRRTADTDPRGKTYDLNDFVSTIKRTFGLKYETSICTPFFLFICLLVLVIFTKKKNLKP